MILEKCEGELRECAFEISELFKPKKPYRIVTASPYLVTKTEMDNIYAFVDLGFSGKIEQSEPSSHSLWGNQELDSAYDEELGSRILMVGLTSLKRFQRFLVDYKNSLIVFDVAPPSGATEVEGARSFKHFESEMFALSSQITDLKGRQAQVFSFIDTGNPRTFIHNEAFRHELSDLGIDSSCKCGTPGLEDISVQNSNLTLKEHDLSLTMAGHLLTNRVRGVCDKTECGSEHTNTTIRNVSVHPAIALNMGNDALTSLKFIYMDFDQHKFYVPTAPSRQKMVLMETDLERMEEEEEREDDSTTRRILFFSISLVVLVVVLSAIVRRKS